MVFQKTSFHLYMRLGLYVSWAQQGMVAIAELLIIYRLLRSHIEKLLSHRDNIHDQKLSELTRTVSDLEERLLQLSANHELQTYNITADMTKLKQTMDNLELTSTEEHSATTDAMTSDLEKHKHEIDASIGELRRQQAHSLETFERRLQSQHKKQQTLSDLLERLMPQLERILPQLPPIA